MPDYQKIREKIKQENDEFYGDESIGGSSPSPDTDDDVVENLHEVIGHPENDSGDNIEEKPFDLGEEINKEEQDLYRK